MADVTELKNYIKRLTRIINSADFAIFGKSMVKKKKVDDLIVCIIALLPESFKKAMKKRVPIDVYPAVASFNRLSKVIRKPFFLSKDYYFFPTSEVVTLLQSIGKNIERDINKLEEEEIGNL